MTEERTARASGAAPGRADGAEGPQITSETLLVMWAALGVGLAALGYCYRHAQILLYGDAVAHLHIARRVIDSLDPGYRQLGSVWLPLPHILLLPFVLNDALWRTGLAGACLSIPCYVLACAGIYRLARMWLPVAPSLIAVALFGLNPGVGYLATTAMTEPLFLAELLWSLVAIAGHRRDLAQAQRAGADAAAKQRSASRHLIAAGILLVCAVFTRYDGWIFATAAWVLVSLPVLRAGNWRTRVGGAWLLFTAMLISAPVLWIAYNARQFGDPLDFMRGPYSAKAIDAKTSPPGSPHYPEYHHPEYAMLYYLKAAEMSAAPLGAGDLLLTLSLAGGIAAWGASRGRQGGSLLLLWLPLPFYAWTIAYGSLPLFIPIWHPFSFYNTRYGIEMLPAFAMFPAFLLAALVKWKPGLRIWAPMLAALVLLANSVALLRAGPLIYREAVANARTRIAFESALARALLALPAKARIVMAVSRDVGAIQQTGMPLRRFVDEGDYDRWRRALADPSGEAPFVVALDGDAMAAAIRRHPRGLRLLKVVCSTGQPCARIYQSEMFPGW